MYGDEQLSLKVLRRDKEALRRMAAAEGEAMSVVVRRLIRKAARERGLWPLPADRHGQEQGETAQEVAASNPAPSRVGGVGNGK